MAAELHMRQILGFTFNPLVKTGKIICCYGFLYFIRMVQNFGKILALKKIKIKSWT